MNKVAMGIILMLLVALVQAIISMLSKILHSSISTIFNSLFYYLIPCIFFIPLVFKRGIHSYKTKFTFIYIIRGFFSVTAVLCFFYASSILSLGQANLLFTTSPIFVALIAGIMLNEPTTKKGFLGIGIAFLGVYCVLNQNTFVLSPLGFFLGILSGFFMAISQVLLKYLVKKDEQVLNIVFFQYLYSTIFMLFIATYKYLINPQIIDSTTYSISIILILLLVVGVVSLLGQIILTKAFQYMPAAKLAPLLYASIPIAAVLDFVCWNRSVSVNLLLGMGLILIGLFINQGSKSNGREAVHAKV